ncbi:MAG TPA: glycerol-3-phosphate ABC transporter ATP-binding protein [Chloroflexi bacterium]|jgi:multiple sugar transport system ATP-binding protein|nr:glycerol-3-phosphate ABC transporter ATP-binding protein [Chloroflexota bacterium]
MAKVTLEHIWKRYGDVVAVHDVSLEAKDEEFLVLVGPSGCGKSTTLRMVAGLDDISEGTISIGERVVNDLSPKDRDIAMVFQSYALYPHMNVYDNMAFGLKLRKTPKQEIRRRVTEAGEILGITPLLDRKPKALSGGQRQRVALGRAIVRNPAVFLMDEPLSNLDAKLRVQTRAEISKLHLRLKTTMIYVTHDQTEAMTMGNRIAVMKDGFLQQTDKPTTLYDYPANTFVAGFIGSPSMNLLPGTLQQSNGSMNVQGDGWTVTLPENLSSVARGQNAEKVVLGIRPEHIIPAVLADGSAAPNKIDTEIEVVENMGSHQYVYLSKNGATLTAEFPADFDAEPLKHTDVVFDPDNLHIFDEASGNAIGHSKSAVA